MNFDKILSSKKEMESVDRSNPKNVVDLLIHTFCNYDPNNLDNFYEMLQYLLGDYQPISAFMKQNIKDRMMQNEKYPYIGKSYFKGATPENNYTPVSYEVDAFENDYSREFDGYVRLFVKSGGSDSPRPITLRFAKDGNYYIWSDSFIGLLADIKTCCKDNPWA